MKKIIYQRIGSVVIALVAIILTANSSARAQEIKMIQATAMGTSTQLGRIVNIDIRISEYSSDEDRTALLQAFRQKRNKGLTNAVEKMRAKGRIAITGTLGFDVNFLRRIDMPDGTIKIRFVTDRPIRFGEAWGQTRSMDYTLAMGEINISKDRKNSTGMLYPAAMFRLDKDKELTLETYQNPWKLQNIQIRD